MKAKRDYEKIQTYHKNSGIYEYSSSIELIVGKKDEKIFIPYPFNKNSYISIYDVNTQSMQKFIVKFAMALGYNGQDYLDALNSGEFVFKCMSGLITILAYDIPYYIAYGKPYIKYTEDSKKRITNFTPKEFMEKMCEKHNLPLDRKDKNWYNNLSCL